MGRKFTISEEVPHDWDIGDVILDTYEVKQVHEGGGMGLVYRVHHQGWNMDLAVKSPRPKYFQTEQQKQNFVRECETWINLGLHPHTVNCFYVRTLGGIPRVFAEYIEGGSLSDWIRKRKLYEGGHGVALKRLLDTAIQFAWGLQYAHENGLVHQDVKPANVMMTLDGTAKVSDFGLSQARAATGETVQARRPGMSMVVPGGGVMTPSYASPEQKNGRTLTRRTDIWSWAVSVYEMFVGDLTWSSGLVVPELLEAYLQEHADNERIPRMPPALADLLRQCLRKNPYERPHDFAAVVDNLKALYLDTYQTPFPRALPERHDLDADTLNNHFISIADLGAVFKPTGQNACSTLLALRTKRPDHTLGRLNDALLHWRQLSLSISDLNRRLDNVYSSPFMPDLEEWQITLELEKCDTGRSQHLLNGLHNKSRKSLMDLSLRYHDQMRSHLAVFFRTRDCALQTAFENSKSSSDDSSLVYAIASSLTGVVAIGSLVERRIVLRDLLRDRVLSEIVVPYHFSLLALSEHATHLACATVSEVKGKEAHYVVSVYNPTDGTLLGTCSGEVPLRTLTSLTLDDDCQCLTLWLKSQSGNVFEQVHDLKEGVLRRFRCDFRKPSPVSAFDRMFLSGDSTLLLGKYGSHCSLWHHPPATREFVNLLDIDLAKFGLINTTGHLPGFALDTGFEYQIDEWNVYDLMRLLEGFRPTTHAAYLLCRPPESAELFARNTAKTDLLRFAAEAEKNGNRLEALAHLNRYCELLPEYADGIMSRRHELAHSCDRDTFKGYGITRARIGTGGLSSLAFCPLEKIVSACDGYRA